ncbi:hypothetical protein MVEN_00430100 [Mycena venus]|uniref:Uncharacterized protein n=1 Tax=Mycena venus TaxID=2733690 RepID=A0A8H6YQV0_9AGAR|nr:hypothetical protein MVEN_00430100 [Mycena venus]
MASGYYCNPPFHSDPDAEWDTVCYGPFWMSMHPWTRDPGPGIYTSEESCTAAIEGIPDSGVQCYYDRSACLKVWHAQCAAGKHPHPAPACPKPESPDLSSSFAGLSVSELPPASSTSQSTPAIPRQPELYYALRGQNEVYDHYHFALERLAKFQHMLGIDYIMHASAGYEYITLVANGMDHDEALAALSEEGQSGGGCYDEMDDSMGDASTTTSDVELDSDSSGSGFDSDIEY